MTLLNTFSYLDRLGVSGQTAELCLSPTMAGCPICRPDSVSVWQVTTSSGRSHQKLAHVHAGLDGTSQIVGMGDTGLDWLHCTFKDSSVAGPGAGPFTKEATTGYLYWANPAHRKVVYYRQVADNIDENGHGTHCAGSAVGSLQSGRF